MKQINRILLAILMVISFTSRCFNQSPSAILDLESTEQGLLIPRTDTTTVNSAHTPAQGLMIYQNSDNSFYYYTGSQWKKVGESHHSELQDNDQDTRIQLEESPDEDIIRMDVKGTEIIRFLADSSGRERIELLNNLQNVFIGEESGEDNTSGKSNSFFGYLAGSSNTTGNYNSFFGKEAGEHNTTGNENSFYGRHAGRSNTTGLGNTFMGYIAGRDNVSGNYNTMLGSWAGLFNTTGDNNTFIGRDAGRFNTTGEKNVFSGTSSGLFNTTGNSNIFLGVSAGRNNNSGSGNTFIGDNAGTNNTKGSKNTLIGNLSNLSTGLDSLEKAMALGYGAKVGCSDCAVIGGTGSNTLNVGIGTELPEKPIHVEGESKFVGQMDVVASDMDTTSTHIGKLAGANQDFSTELGNTFAGSLSGEMTTTGHSNAFFGTQAGQTTQSGEYNSFFGRSSGIANSAGDDNSFFGVWSGFTNTSGTGNTFIGKSAGYNNDTGSHNTLIGVSSDFSIGNDDLNKAIAIGYNAEVGCNNCAVIGGTGTDAVNVGIGLEEPETKLHIKGGSDASLTGDGYLIMGNTTGTNVVLDNNELMARNNGAASSLFINADGGKVGVGTNSASDKLHVNSDSGENPFRVQVNGGTKMRIYSNGSISLGSNTGLSADKVHVHNNYKMGIGVTNPEVKLEVDGGIKISDSVVNSPQAGTVRWNTTTEDFEGYTGEKWVSLTQQRNIWGSIKSTPNQKLKASDAADQDHFGRPAISGNTAVIGTADFDGNGSNSGAVYIFEYNGSFWEQKAKLTASDAAANDGLGRSVAISGDVVIAAAPWDNGTFSDSGSAYIFVKPASGWSNMTETAKLTSSDAFTNDEFGFGVDIDGDVAIVGAWQDESGATDSGSAYIFKKPAAGWSDMTQTAKLTSTAPQISDHSGWSVAIEGTVAVVGVFGDNPVADQTGSIHVYQRPAAGWSNMTETAILTASDAVDGYNLGYSVSISKDVIVGGDPFVNEAAYVFEKPSGGWTDMTETGKLQSSDGGSSVDWFGVSIQISDNDVLVGAPLENEGGNSSGAAYIFHKPSGGWTDMTETAKLKTSVPASSSQVGLACSISKNFIMLAELTDSDIINQSGATYFFKR